MPDSCILAGHHYGKSGIRLMKVERQGTGEELKDLSIDIEVFGPFDSAWRDGCNEAILPTDTMKNTVYAFARREPVGEIESFALRLADHFMTRNAHFGRVRVAISETLWEKTSNNSSPHDHSFRQAGPERRTARIDMDRESESIRAGICNLSALKTHKSSFEHFCRDEYTNLQETRNRLLRTEIASEWTYAGRALNFGALWNSVRATLLETFARHESRSVQHTAFTLGREVLSLFESIREIRLSIPNQHCLLVDLQPFGLDNPNEVFVPTDCPSGVTETTLSRSNPL